MTENELADIEKRITGKVTELLREEFRQLKSAAHVTEIPLAPAPAPWLAGGAVPELLTIHEVAATLRVSPQTVHHWKKQGKIEFTQIGRAVRFPASVLSRKKAD
ncbi:hypothetical protein AGMMS49991_04690 [Spirochaetia bacterium]|nr:hypothetical protein AGMMS49991_04690 [Spirochaetia bacterium]